MKMDSGTIAVLLPMLLLLLGLGFTLAIDPYIRRGQRRVMFLIVLLCLSLIVQNLWDNALFVSRSHPALKYFLSACGYSVTPVLLILFLYLIRPDGKKWPAWALAGINAALCFSSPFTKLCFEIRESDFASLRGPLWFSRFLIGGVLLIWLLALTIIRFRQTRKLEQLLPVFVVLIIVLSAALDVSPGMTQQPVDFLTMALVIGSVFFYIWLHLQVVREHERDLEAAQRIRIMMTQIQPHFLFNSLNTIRALYAKDPPLADRTLENFSTYLRQNLESLQSPDLIPITKELEHTRLYAETEMLRFPGVHVEYRVEDREFQIPALTIQPLMENAIRHGVRMRENGLVIVSTARESGAHRITIEDNGAGFDPEKTNFTDGSHIGIQSVKDRVERMCGGTMTLESEIGKGTRVTLLIPDRNERDPKEKRI